MLTALIISLVYVFDATEFFVFLVYLCNWTRWASEGVEGAVLEEEVAEVRFLWRLFIF